MAVRDLKVALLLGSFCGFFSCSVESNDPLSNFDHSLFSTFGGTLIGTPREQVIRDVHLDGGGLLSKEIIINGAVVESGEHGSYLILADEDSRMLVDLSGIKGLPIDKTPAKGEKWKIMGVVKSGKKGHYYLVGHALHPL